MYIHIKYPGVDRNGRRDNSHGGCARINIDAFRFKPETHKLDYSLRYSDVRYIFLLFIAAAVYGYNACLTKWDETAGEYVNTLITGRDAVTIFLDHCSSQIPGVLTPAYLKDLTKKLQKGMFNYV